MLHIQTLYVVSGAQVNRMDKKMDNMQIIHSETCLFSHFTIPCPALSLEQYRCLHFKWIVIFFIYLFIYKSTMYILTKYIYFYLYIYVFLHFAQVEIISFMCVCEVDIMRFQSFGNNSQWEHVRLFSENALNWCFMKDKRTTRDVLEY